jgi:hypothetical protein
MSDFVFNLLKETKVKRLDESEVERVFRGGVNTRQHNNLQNFASRLLRKYFSLEERSKATFDGQRLRGLDPIRIGFIRSHLTDRNQGRLSNEQWQKVQTFMFYLRKRNQQLV